MSRSVIMEREFAHAPEKIWRALTEGHLIEEWLMKNTFKPIVGEKFELRTDPRPHWDGVVQGKVLSIEPLKSLCYQWNAGDNLQTVVTWTLEATASGTRLRMEQTGFTDADEQNYRGAQYGWEKFLAALGGVVERLR